MARRIVSIVVLVLLMSVQRAVAATVTPAIGTAWANSTTACTNLKAGPLTLVAIVFDSSVAQQAGTNLAIYDSTTTCNSTTEIYDTGTVGAGAVILLNIPVGTEVSYTFTGGSFNGGFRIITS